MVYDHVISFVLTNFIYFLLSFLFSKSGSWVLLTFICKFQIKIVLVAGQDRPSFIVLVLIIVEASAL